MRPPIYQVQKFTLRPYEPKDEDNFVFMGTDPVSVAFMGGANGDEAEDRALFKTVFSLYEKTDTKRWFWIWGVYEGDKLCGHFELKDTQHTAPDELEIVYMVHPDERGRGVMKAVLDFCKEQQEVWKRRIIATVDFDNVASLALLNRWGIVKKEIVEEDDGESYWKVWLV